MARPSRNDRMIKNLMKQREPKENKSGCEKEKKYCDIIEERLKQSNLERFFG